MCVILFLASFSFVFINYSTSSLFSFPPLSFLPLLFIHHHQQHPSFSLSFLLAFHFFSRRTPRSIKIYSLSLPPPSPPPPPPPLPSHFHSSSRPLPSAAAVVAAAAGGGNGEECGGGRSVSTSPKTLAQLFYQAACGEAAAPAALCTP